MPQKTENLSAWKHVILAMSVLSLVVVGFQTFGPATIRESSLLFRLDLTFCVLFFADFLWQFVTASSKTQYMRWGWLDLISSIPMIPALRIARLARIARIIRVIRISRAGRDITQILVARRTRNTFSAVLLGAVVLLFTSAVAIASFDPSLSPGDAVWWCVFTLASGEYGEYYPASTEGKIVAILLMTAGVAVFGTFTASVASFFLEEEHALDEQRDKSTMRAIEDLQDQVRQIRALLDREKKGDVADGYNSKESR